MSAWIEPILPWVVYVVALPQALGALAAAPFWLKRRIMPGNAVGSLAIAGVIFVLIWIQYGAYVRAQEACAGTGIGCAAVTGGLAQFGPYLALVGLGWLDVFVLLILSGRVEDWVKQRHFDRSRL